MRRTTIFLDESTDRELLLLAQRERVPVAALVREALDRYLEEPNRNKRLRLDFLAIGRSGHHDTAERAEEILWGDLDPHTGRRRTRRTKTRNRADVASFGYRPNLRVR
jgi:hypothetical protein